MPLQRFIEHIKSVPRAHILELGTRRSIENRPTHHKEWASEAHWVLSDFQDGHDVEVIADAHKLSETFSAEFDAVVACSVFEHIQRPWIAAGEIYKVLKPGGLVFIQTHQTFILHAHTFDYWRYTVEALKTIFEDAKMETLETWYDFPCRIVSKEAWTHALHPEAKAFLNSNIICRKSRS